MIRAIVENLPHAVLLSGAKADLVLLGARDADVQIDPVRLASALERAPDVRADLQRVALGTVREIVGTFIGSARNLADATRNTPAASDDRPIQEYSVRSLLGSGVPARVSSSAPLIDLSQIPTWCPRCFVDGKPVPLVEGIDTYLTLLDEFYTEPAGQTPGVAEAARPYGSRIIQGSAYLGAILPESAGVHNVLGIALTNSGMLDEAIAEFREALRLDPALAAAHWRLGKALASRGREDAIEHLRRSVELSPENMDERRDFATALLAAGRLDEAVSNIRAALQSMQNATG